MPEIKEQLDFESFNAQSVLDQIKQDVETKGSLDLTELANESVEHSPLLTACRDAIGEDPFAWVMKRAYDDNVGEIRFKLNPDLLLGLLPEQFASKLKALAVQIRRDELGDKNPEFQAFKRAISSELCKSILVTSKGRVQLKWDESYGTDFAFTHAHTSDEKKAAIEARRQEKAEQQSGGQRVYNMRNKFRRNRR